MSFNFFKESGVNFLKNKAKHDAKDELEQYKSKYSPSELFGRFKEQLHWDEAELDGLVRVSLIQAQDLMIKDKSIAGGKSDPYVKVFLEEEYKGKTSTKHNNLNPVWKEVVEFQVKGKYEYINLYLYDKDMVGADDFLGRAEISVKDVWEDRTVKRTGKELKGMKPAKEGEKPTPAKDLKAQGTIDYIVEYEPARIDGVLKVNIEKALGVVAEDTFSSAGDPYVYVLLDSKVLGKTSVKKNTNDPEWNEEFEFNVSGEYTKLYLSVWDEDKGRDDYISHLEIPVLSLLEQKPIAGPTDLFHDEGSKKGRKKKEEGKEEDKKPLEVMGVLYYQVSWSPPVVNGKVEVVVEQAVDLRSADFLKLFGNVNDVYVSVLLDEEEKAKTAVVKSDNPQWNETLSFDSDGCHKFLSLVVWDKDKLTSNDALGCVHVSAQQVITEKEVSGDFVLIPYKGCVACGSLSFSLKFSSN